MTEPQITVAVPSFNQGRYLNDALQSIFSQGMNMEVVVLDAGSSDESIAVIKKWESRLLFWRSSPDAGQAAAINEGIIKGKAPYVCWLNADDIFLPDGLKTLSRVLEKSHGNPAVYGRCWTIGKNGKRLFPYLTAPFRPWLLANYCHIAQPATLMLREAWEGVGGLDESLHMALDYDLWWRLYRSYGRLKYVRKFVAATRMHADTKTRRKRKLHYMESMEVIRRHWGRVPLKWYTAWPFMVTLRSALRRK